MWSFDVVYKLCIFLAMHSGCGWHINWNLELIPVSAIHARLGYSSKVDNITHLQLRLAIHNHIEDIFEVDLNRTSTFEEGSVKPEHPHLAYEKPSGAWKYWIFNDCSKIVIKGKPNTCTCNTGYGKVSFTGSIIITKIGVIHTVRSPSDYAMLYCSTTTWRF